MLEQTLITERMGMEILGQLHRFAEQLGGAAPELLNLASAPLYLPLGRVDSLPVLRQFLESYYARVLVPCELPAIFQAYEHAHRSELRELIAADLNVSREAVFQAFAGASQFVGTAQLKRLRPLRDQRLVQRYLSAVEKGEACGWHTIVYGLILSVYSLPLRQGLLNYAQQTIGGFIKSARFSLKLPHPPCDQLHQDICSLLPQAVDSIVRNHSPQTMPLR